MQMMLASRSWKPLVTRKGTAMPMASKAQGTAHAAARGGLERDGCMSAPHSFEVAQQAVGPEEQDYQDEREDDRLGIQAGAVAGHQRFDQRDQHAARRR